MINQLSHIIFLKNPEERKTYVSAPMHQGFKPEKHVKKLGTTNAPQYMDSQIQHVSHAAEWSSGLKQSL